MSPGDPLGARARKREPQLRPAEREHYRHLGVVLSQLRKQQGWSRLECEARSGVSARAWQYFEDGETVPRPAVFSAMFQIFGWSVTLLAKSPKDAGKVEVA